MTLILVVPGLLWPRQIMRDTLYDAEFPALQTLLGKGHRLPATSMSADAWWCSLFGIRPEHFAPAPLRLSALGGDVGDSIWLCADPVNLHVQPGGAILKDPALLAIDADEAAQLHATLAPLLSEVGELVITTPSQWHLRLRTVPPSFPTRLHELIGESATSLLPSGTEGRSWRQSINDVQIALHQHPVNIARTEHHRPPINSIALWGAGTMPAISTAEPATLLCDDPVIVGLGRCAGLSVAPVTEAFTAAPVIASKAKQSITSATSGAVGSPRACGPRDDCKESPWDDGSFYSKDVIVHWDKLLKARADHDAMRWREGLQQLENDWLAPALSALTGGTLKRIELHGFGDEAPLSLSMTSLDRYCFWRKLRRLETV